MLLEHGQPHAGSSAELAIPVIQLTDDGVVAIVDYDPGVACWVIHDLREAMGLRDCGATFPCFRLQAMFQTIVSLKIAS
jgi:hypothetical protein